LSAQAVVLTRNPDRFKNRAPRLAADPALRLVQGDVRTLAAGEITRQLGVNEPARFSFVIHGASETTLSANEREPVKVLETSLEGTRRALDFAVESGAKNFLLLSSGAVYGEQPPAMTQVPESYRGAPDVALPLSAYGEGKRLAEMLCAIYQRAHGLDCRLARCFAFVGPYLALDAHYAIGNFLADVLARRPIAVKGDGTPWRSYMYAADLAVWLWTLLLDPRATGTYNVGSGCACTIREMAECVARLGPTPVPVTVARAADPSRPASRYVPDVTRAKRELGLDSWISLEQAVRRTLTFHQQSQIASL